MGVDRVHGYAKMSVRALLKGVVFECGGAQVAAGEV